MSHALALRVAGVGLLSLMHVVLGRFLGADDYGIFSFTVAVVGLGAVVATMGMPVILQRFVAEYTARHEWPQLLGVLLRSFQLTLLTSVTAGAIMFMVPHLIALPPDRAIALRFAALLIPVMALVKLRRNALQGLHNIPGMLVPEEIVLPLLVVTGTVLWGLSDVVSALWLYFGVAVGSFALGTFWLQRSLPSETGNARPAFRTNLWLSTALPMLASDLSKYAMNRADVLLLGSMANMGAVGLYAAANRLAALVPFFMVAVNAAAAPLLATTFGAGKEDDFRLVLRQSLLWASAGALPVFGALIVFPSFWLGLFGAEFAEGGTLLRILAGGQLINAASGPVGFALIMSGRERVFAGLVFGTATFNVIGNFWAIPLFGAVGAASVTAATVAALNAGCFVALRRTVENEF